MQYNFQVRQTVLGSVCKPVVLSLSFVVIFVILLERIIFGMDSFDSSWTYDNLESLNASPIGRTPFKKLS